MIAFATAIQDAERYRQYAWPGIEHAREPDSRIFAYTSASTLGQTLNAALDRAAALPDLEALVLVGESTRITDADLASRVRAELTGTGVAAAGPVGASGVTSLAWWEAEVSAAEIPHHYHEHGGGVRRAYDWARPTPAPADVDVLDGLLIALTPEVVRAFRFDEGLRQGYGADVDFSLRLREAGHRLRTAPFGVATYAELKPLRDIELWAEAHIAFAERWQGRFPGRAGETTDWKARARRAEAEREAARTMAYSTSSQLDARLLEAHARWETWGGTLSWRATAPLRLTKRGLAHARARRDASGIAAPQAVRRTGG